MPRATIEVFDAEGVRRLASPIDAQEIIAAGGSYELPAVVTEGVVYSEAEAEEQAKPKTKAKK